MATKQVQLFPSPTAASFAGQDEAPFPALANYLAGLFNALSDTERQTCTVRGINGLTLVYTQTLDDAALAAERERLLMEYLHSKRGADPQADAVLAELGKLV